MEVSWSFHSKKWNQHLSYLSAFLVDFLFSLLSIPNSSKSVKVETWIINPRNISKFADFGRRARHNSQKAEVKILISMSRGQKDLLQLRIILRILLNFLSQWFLVQVARFSSPILWNCFLFLRPGVTSWWGLAPKRQKQWQLDQRPSLSEGRKIHKKKYTKCLLERVRASWSWTEERISIGKIENTVFCR